MDWERIIDAAEEVVTSRGGNKTELANILGVRPQYLADIRSGKSKNPGSDFTLSLINKMNFDPLWIQTAQGNIFQNKRTMQDSLTHVVNEMKEDLAVNYTLFKFLHGNGIPVAAERTDNDAMVMLPVYCQCASAKEEQSANQLPIIEAYMPVLYELLNGANPKNCGIVRIIGDSMTDMNLFNKDIVIFDCTMFKGDGLYFISIGKDVLIKRLEYRPFEKKIIISSENAKHYPDSEVITYEQAENLLHIHGKVIGWMHHHPY